MSTPRVYQISLRASEMRRLMGPLGRITALVGLFFILLATTFYSGSSASSRAALRGHRSESLAGVNKSIKVTSKSEKKAGGQLATKAGTAPLPSFLSAYLVPQSPLGETVTTYAADCETPKSAFNFGDTVCAKIEGGPPLLVAPRRFSWVSPDNVVQSLSTVQALPETNVFQIPARDPNNDFREVWRVNSISSRSSIRASAFFTVSDPNDLAANLEIYNSVNTSDLSGGSDIEFALWIVNRGPDPAVDVQLTNVATNATFVSVGQDVGPTFTCNPSTGGTTCTIATLEAGTKARIAVLYHVVGGATVGTVISNTAAISSTTTDAHTDDNSATAQVVITNDGGGAACSLICPGNITRTANTTQNTQAGALVTFDSEVSGDCGTVTASHGSGSLFAVGDTTVQINSSSGESCSFTVTVTDTAAPTISCPANLQKDAGADCSIEVTLAELGTPTTTGNNVTVDSDRSDGKTLDAPFSIGVTTIVWTATDADGRTTSCSQTVTVTGTDTTPPTITAPPSLTDSTGAGGATCGKIIGETELGTPIAEDNCSTVHVVRTGVPAGNFFPIGTTTITYTATDGAGNAAAPVTQTVTINDDTPPVIFAPADASYVCRSEVPAASPSQATGPDIDVNGQPQPGPPSDNCGAPTVTVSETRSGSGSASSPLIITRTFTATDAAHNSTSSVQTITVIDPTPPTIIAPAPVVLNTGAGATSCGVTVGNLDGTLGTGIGQDNCSVVTVTRSGVPAGNNFPVGVTTITYTATDEAGNTATAAQTVTVFDNTPPTVTAPPAVTLFTGAGAVSCGVTVSNLNATLGAGSANDNCSGVGPVTRSGVPAGNVFPLGQTTLTYSATDAHGNSASAIQVVTVVDNTPPTISCVADIIADFNPAVSGATVNYTAPVGADNCGGATTIQTAGLASGATFPLGTTTNTFKVTDAAGNTATCSFKVTVALTSIVGLDSVSISGAALVDSYDSNGGYPATKGSLANVLSNGTITFSNSGKLSGNVRSTRAGVNMSGATQVTGNATAGTTVTRTGSATVGGTITNNLLAPVMTLPAVPACGPPYSPNSGITGTYSYNPATGDLNLSGVNVATLANGTYCFRNVTVSNSAQLKVNGPVVLKITGTLTASGATSLPNMTGIPSNLRILSSYSGTSGVTFGNSTNVHLMVYAPKTGVSISGAAPLFGTVVGKTVTISNSGMLHYDTRLKTIWPAVWNLILGP